MLKLKQLADWLVFQFHQVHQKTLVLPAFFDDFLSMTLSTLPLVGFIFVICPLARMFFYCWSICAYIALYSTQMHSVKVVKFQWVFELLSFVVEMIQFDDYIKLGASTTNYKVGPLPVIYIYIPRTQLTSIFEGQPPKTRPFPFKTRVIWVLRIYK